MSWNLEEAISYYRKQGAPRDQSALIGLLREIQQEFGGAIPESVPGILAAEYKIKENLILAVIKRIPSLHLGDFHCLEICSGPNCGRHSSLADFAEELAKNSSGKITVKYVPCMRMCGRGPNIRWDGQVYHHTEKELLSKLGNETGKRKT